MTKYEISAGGIVGKRDKKGLAILLLQDPKGEWTFPKGLVEENEDPRETAIREIAEEVGLKNLQYLAKIGTVEYFFRRGTRLVKKTVFYYLFLDDQKGQPRPQREEGISAVRWFSPQEALAIVGYKKTNENLLRTAKGRLEEHYAMGKS